MGSFVNAAFIGLLFFCLLSVNQGLIFGGESILSKILNKDADGGGGIGGIAVCPVCQLILSKLQTAVKSGIDTDKIASVMEMKCIEMNVASPLLCRSMIPLYKGVFFSVMKTTPLSFLQICGQVIGHKACNLDAKPFVTWDIELPKKPKPPTKSHTPKIDKPNMRIVHLTDFHYDPLYTEGAKVTCPEPICCRKENGMAGFRTPAAGMFGHGRNCDLPKVTLVSLFEHLASIEDQFDMVICTGDLPPHDIWKQSKEGNVHIIREITTMFFKYLPGKRIFFAVGNHESIPADNFPPPDSKSESAPHWLYPTLSKAWALWLRAETRATVEKGGFYSVSAYNGLRIISLNTVFCYHLNLWLLVDSVDPAGQLKWLVSELEKAEESGEVVYIIGHISPGDKACLPEWKRNYFKIISRFSNTVVAQFFGHTHKDSFQVSYNQESSQPETISYIAGSVTPYMKTNPGFRIYDIDASREQFTRGTWTVIDHKTYFLNLTEANISKKAEWKLEYSAKDAYKMKSLLPGDWDKVIKNLESNDDLFQEYYRYHHKSYPTKKCSAKCKKPLVCSLRFGNASDSC